MTICVNMIVKNEAPVIARCLASVRPWVDRWVIHDTGSTDGTQALCWEAMRGIPGRVVENPWVYEVHNRNAALVDAKATGCDYVLIIDADETFDAPPGWQMPHLEHDGYDIIVRADGWEWPRMGLFTKDGWEVAGKRLHPWMRHERGGAITRATLPGACITHHADGHTWSDPEKYAHHVELMRLDLGEDPDNPRLLYYLAQSLHDSAKTRPHISEAERVTLLTESATLFAARARHSSGPAHERLSACHRAMALYAHLSHPAHARALLPTLALIHAAHGHELRPTFTRTATAPAPSAPQPSPTPPAGDSGDPIA